MTREDYFLKYNNDNIMTNLLQAEDHLRNLSQTDNEQGHNACIIKHLLITEGEANEAISHAEEPTIYYNIRAGCNNLRVKLSSINIGEAIKEVRGIRKNAERLDPSYNISNCRACEKISEALPKSLNSRTSIENDIDNNNHRGVRMDLKKLGVINGGQAAGFMLKYGADYIDTKYPATTSTSPFASKGLWAAVIVGVGGQILAEKYIKNEDLKLGVIAGCSYLLISKVGDVVKGYVQTPAARMRLQNNQRLPMRPGIQARITPTRGGGGGASFVTVD